jgi:protein tyrosine phosphatase (PTP) superfamily phosphohydrolase (DUF442 family)
MSDARPLPIVNFLRIDATLATSGQPSVDELAALARDGTEVVINLALHDDPRYSLPDEAATVAALGMTYVHIPVKFDAPKESELFEFFDAMERHRGRNCLVHCAANKRVTAFLGLYRTIREGWDAERAFEPMRSIWEPNAAWAPFIATMLEKHAPPRAGQ